MSQYYFSNLYHEVCDKVEYLDNLNDGTTFKVPDQNIYLYISDGGCSWFSKPVKRLSFDRVLEMVSDDMKDKLLFNLNIFRVEDKFDSYLKLKLYRRREAQ